MPLALNDLDASIETRPTLRTDLAAAKQIDVVIIRTPRDKLIDQLRRRSILWRVPPFCRTAALPISGLLLWIDSLIPAPVAGVADKLLGHRWHKATLTRSVEAKLLELYAQDDALDAIYRQFERALTSLFGDRTASLVYVEPCADGGFRRL